MLSLAVIVWVIVISSILFLMNFLAWIMFENPSISSLIQSPFSFTTARYSFSANLKSLYLNMKYKYSDAGDHLAVVNQDGLWIKEKSDDGKKI